MTVYHSARAPCRELSTNASPKLFQEFFGDFQHSDCAFFTNLFLHREFRRSDCCQAICMHQGRSVNGFCWNNWQFTTWCLYILPNITTFFAGGLLWPFFRHFRGEMTLPKLNTWRENSFHSWRCDTTYGDINIALWNMERSNFKDLLFFRQVCLNLKVCFFTLQVIYTDLSTINSMRTTRKVLGRTTSYKWCTSQKSSIKLEIESVKKA